MVGVPRSKGCRTCVQRKVRCDQTHPICGNCTKAKRTCLGYAQESKFQDEGPRLREKYGKTHTSSVLPQDGGQHIRYDRFLAPESETTSSSSTDECMQWNATGLDLAAPGKITLLGFVEGKVNAYLGLNLDHLAVPKAENINLFTPYQDSATYSNSTCVRPALLSPGLMQDQLFEGFRDCIAPDRQDFLPKAMKNYAIWMKHLPDLTGTDLLLDTAVRAVTLVHIGRFHNSTVCLNESRPFYGKALRLLNRSIADKELGMSNTTLCATMLLSYYEMFASDDDASWVRHAGGASALMRMRGPERHRTGFDREIFLSYRHTLISEAFSSDTSSFLNEPAWRTLSSDIHDDIRKQNLIPPNRTELFEVVELYNQQLARLTHFAAKAHKLCHPTQGSSVKADSSWLVAYADLKAALDDMKAIFADLTAAIARLGLLPKPFKTKDPVVPIEYTYPNVFLSVIFAGFWTTQMVCNLHLLMLGFAFVDVVPTMKKDLATIEDENMDFSIECCRSVNYMLKSSFLGPFFAVYAMRLASRSFPYAGLEWKWTIAKLYHIGERHMLFAKHMPRFDVPSRDGDGMRDTESQIKKKLAGI